MKKHQTVTFNTWNNKNTKDEDGENVLHFEITEVVLFHCNIINNYYQHDSRVWYRFVPNKLFGQSLNIWAKGFKFLKAFTSEFIEYINLYWSMEYVRR